MARCFVDLDDEFDELLERKKKESGISKTHLISAAVMEKYAQELSEYKNRRKK